MNESELQQRIADLEAENARLKKQNIEKSEFLSMVSHQLRTPLSGIKWTLKMLMDDATLCFTPEHKNFLDQSMQSSERMIRLLQEVMVANQKETWKFSYRLKPLQLHHLIEQVTNDYTDDARGKNIHLDYSPDANTTDTLVRADKDKVILVLENLVENAIKYNEPYGTISVGLSRYSTTTNGIDRDLLKVTVHNTGLAIPLDEQSKIFAKFYRASNARKKIQTGTGLGLFTAKQVIEQMGGGIWFTSQPEKGTTFYFTLPIVKTEIGSLSTSHHLRPAIEYKT